MLASVRPNDIDLALFVHIAGAMALVGGLVTAAVAGIVGWRGDAVRLGRFSVMTLLAVALPGWFIMRVGAEWTYNKENLDSLTSDPTWLGIGFSLADGGGVLLLLALVLGGIGMRQSRRGKGERLLKASGAIAALLVVAYAVAVWAMGAKPS
jgi:hypothetical protein